jgi:hypothetical protein
MSHSADPMHRYHGVAWQPTDARAHRYARRADARFRRRLRTAAAVSRRAAAEAVGFFRAWP